MEETIKIIADKSAESELETSELLEVVNTAATELVAESDVAFYIAVHSLLHGDVMV